MCLTIITPNNHYKNDFEQTASLVGIFLFALLIDYVHSVMQLSSNEKLIYDWLSKKNYDDTIRHEAARLIQVR